MKTIFDDGQRGALIERLQRVQSMRMAVGELETKPRNLSIRFAPLR